MKIFKTIIVLALLAAFSACDVDYYVNPNEPVTPPTSAVLNNTMYEMITDTRDEWFAGRFTLATMQYWQQSEYGDEDRYSYRESMRETWEDLYYNLENMRQVILLNADETTASDMAAYGDNNNQIQTMRILMAWTFNMMTDTWGDIPYYSYGSDNADFQALMLGNTDLENQIIKPKYATQDQIYTDILTVLQEAEASLDESKSGFTGGDNIYDGDVAMWKKFANSLRLRIAMKMKGFNASLGNQHIADAISKGVFESNADNAGFEFENNASNGAPMYVAWNVDNRSDFAAGHSFVTLLKGENLMNASGADLTDNPFAGMVDPRLPLYVQPNGDGVYQGMPIAETSAEAATITFESLPGDGIINKADFTEMIMEYAEVQFLLSEQNGWDQTYYENGVRASMERWGVEAADIDAYIAALPPANEENVLTQKYIALYMQSHTAWSEYRRTGYPHTLIEPFEQYSITYDDFQYDFTFNPIPSEIGTTNDLPYRMEYPDQEYTLNGDMIQEAVNRLDNGDMLSSKLIWDVD